MKLTEEEWENSIDSAELLEYVRKSSPRKFRLFACTCFRAIQDVPLQFKLQSDVLQLVDLAEQIADGAVGDQERLKALRSTAKWRNELGSFRPAARATLAKDSYKAALSTLSAMEEEFVAIENELRLEEWVRLIEIREVLSPEVREIFGNPFQPVKFNKKWLTSDVKLLAVGIYKAKAFDRMPILADALQDAECDSDQLLEHLREHHTTHVRGCWALDLVLGNE